MAAGFPVRGYDVAAAPMRAHAERGGVLATSPADAAHGASVIMTCLMTADIVREALLGARGALDAAAPGAVVIDASTIHPDGSAAIAAELARRGIAMLDAPIGGSSGQARRREAPVVVGGDRAVFDRCRPVLDAIARNGPLRGPERVRRPRQARHQHGARAQSPGPGRRTPLRPAPGTRRPGLAGRPQGQRGLLARDGHQGRAHARGALRAGGQARPAPQGRGPDARGRPRGRRPAHGDRAPPPAPAGGRRRRLERARQLLDHGRAPLAHRAAGHAAGYRGPAVARSGVDASSAVRQRLDGRAAGAPQDARARPDPARLDAGGRAYDYRPRSTNSRAKEPSP